MVDEPGGRGLDEAIDDGSAPGAGDDPRVVGDREAGRILGKSRGLRPSEDRIGEEGAGGPGVVVRRIQDHALGAAQCQHSLAHLTGIDAGAHIDVESRGQLTVGDGGGQGRLAHVEGRREHDPAARRPPRASCTDIRIGQGALESGVAVGQTQLRQRKVNRSPRGAVPGAHGGQELGDLGAVGADVLHGSGTDRAGDARQRGEAAPVGGNSLPHEVIPGGARRGGDLRAPAGVIGDQVDVGARIAHDDPVEAAIGGQDVGAAADHKQRRAFGIGLPDDVDELGLVGGLDIAAHRAAHAQSRQLGQTGRLRLCLRAGHPAERLNGRGPVGAVRVDGQGHGAHLVLEEGLGGAKGTGGVAGGLTHD